MKKMLVLAALAGGMFTAAPLPVMAATPIPAKCLILPLLQGDCREAIAARHADHHAAVAAKVEDSKAFDALTTFPLPGAWLRCTPAPADAAYLLACDW